MLDSPIHDAMTQGDCMHIPFGLMCNIHLINMNGLQITKCNISTYFHASASDSFVGGSS